MTYKVKGKEIDLAKKGVTIHFELNSRLMVLNGMQIYLSRPIADVKGYRFLGKADFTGLLDQLMRPPKLPKKQVMTILLDPGHGGKDTGAIAKGKSPIYEKEINLNTAFLVAQALRRAGFRVVMTRMSDKEVSLPDRVAMVNKIKADLYISLHCNSAASPVKGLETYLATRVGDCAMGSTIPTKKTCPANAYDAQNLTLATKVHREILKRTGMADRGVRHFQYYVIRNAPCPSILVEMGFLSTPAELREMSQTARQQKIAEAITAAVIQYRDLCKPIVP